MIVGLGLDIAAVAPFADEARRERFTLRNFTQGERDYVASRGVGAAQSAAAVFASKEAALKSFGLGIGDLPMLDIEVLHAPTGKPSLTFHNKAASIAADLGVTSIHMSITHQDNYAAAVVILEAS